MGKCMSRSLITEDDGDNKSHKKCVAGDATKVETSKLPLDLVVYSPLMQSQTKQANKGKNLTQPNRGASSPLSLSSLVSDDDSDTSEVNDNITVVLAEKNRIESKNHTVTVVNGDSSEMKRKVWNDRYLAAVVPKPIQQDMYQKYMGTSFSNDNSKSCRPPQPVGNPSSNHRPVDTYSNQNSAGNEKSGCTSKDLTIPLESTKKAINTEIIDDTCTNRPKETGNHVFKDDGCFEVCSSPSAQTNRNMTTPRGVFKPPMDTTLLNQRNKPDDVENNKSSYQRTIEDANDAINRLRSAGFRGSSTKRPIHKEVPIEQISVSSELKKPKPLDMQEETYVSSNGTISTQTLTDSEKSETVNEDYLPAPYPGSMRHTLNVRTSPSSNYSTVRKASDAIARLRSVSKGKTGYWEQSTICSDLSETFSWADERDDMLSYLRQAEDKENSSRKQYLGRDPSCSMSTLSLTRT